MNFDDKEIEEFIDIWEKEFNEKLTPGQARLEAGRLMELYSVLAQRLPGEE